MSPCLPAFREANGCLSVSAHSPGSAEFRSPGDPTPGIQEILRGSSEYPARLESRMGESSPARIWCDGDMGRIDQPQVAIVGSRGAPETLLAAARRFAKALSDDGWVITSGLARGSDSAAHQGACLGQAGTLAIPACGLFRANLRGLRIPTDSATLMSIAPPLQTFNAGTAIRRNLIVAALADVLILVATDLKGGSWYAVRECQIRGTPIVCLESGAHTAEGNAWLLRKGKATPLSTVASPGDLCAVVYEAYSRSCPSVAGSSVMESLSLFD